MNKRTNDSRVRVLITGVGGPAGVNTVRLFSNTPGVEVFGADIDTLAAGRHFLTNFLISPRVSDTAAYEAWLQTTIKQEQIDIFLPTVHEELVVVDTLRSELPCYTVLSSHDSIVVGDNKLVCYAWMQEHMPTAVVSFTSLAAWTTAWSTAPQQFVKPAQGRGARGCRVLTVAEISDLQKTEAEPEAWVVMELLPGTEWTVDAYRASDGTMVYVVPRTRVGLAGGISIKGKTDKNQILIDLTTTMCEKLGVVGPVCIQWKADSTGAIKLIEINPRLSGGLPISVAGGIDPVAAILADYKGVAPQVQSWQEVTSVGYFEYKIL
jgi:carbamoyl-phosphate synthase large subunit